MRKEIQVWHPNWHRIGSDLEQQIQPELRAGFTRIKAALDLLSGVSNKPVTRSASTRKGKAAAKKSTTKKGINKGERINNPYGLDDSVNPNDLREEIIVEIP
jgi:Ser-tRNA(Ala) deacylase AlaX